MRRSLSCVEHNSVVVDGDTRLCCINLQENKKGTVSVMKNFLLLPLTAVSLHIAKGYAKKEQYGIQTSGKCV